MTTPLSRVADPQYDSRTGTLNTYRDLFGQAREGDGSKITAAQAVVSSTEFPLRASIFNDLTSRVNTVQATHATNVTNVLEADRLIWFNETAGQEGWVQNLVTTARTAYDSTATYRKNSIVTYTVNNVNGTYIAKSNVPTGTAPTDTTYWLGLALEGEQGNPYWGVSYKGIFDSTLAYSAKDMVKVTNGRVVLFYVAMEDMPASSSLENWLLAITMYESRILQTTTSSGTYMLDDGSDNVTLYNASGGSSETLYVYTLISNSVIPSTDISYIANGTMMNTAFSSMTLMNNLY